LDIEVLAFDLVAAAQSPGTTLDPELQVFDQIIILPIPNVEEADLNLTVDDASIARDGDDIDKKR